ncbi:uncharacterized protein BJ171DRAFT_631556 [Polychytrium aggregatum]|uniref:uncharacterized protein n=1 Tax=Polychytrium aggregatum TaxID=110093 RepID=UPI0022FDEDE4|nr:uncharacterized protein BJ171DRAFT_631556 [Polychytrium aggregatum]KAI9199454.1 hypothetical protein BJ171DRAFT_631556 [Polychytrium aggregatum]
MLSQPFLRHSDPAPKAVTTKVKKKAQISPAHQAKIAVVKLNKTKEFADDSSSEEGEEQPDKLQERMEWSLHDDMGLELEDDTEPSVEQKASRKTRIQNESDGRAPIQKPGHGGRTSEPFDWGAYKKLRDAKQADAAPSVEGQSQDAEYSDARADSRAGGQGTAGAVKMLGPQTKIIELSKKARKLTMALEKERGINASLAAKLEEIQRQLQVQKEEKIQLCSASNLDQLHIEMRGAKEKLSLATRKLEEERIQNHSAKAEIRQLQKLLAQEIGDGVPISQLIEGSPSWRGRSQQIALLKEKVRELTQTLSNQVVAPGSGVSPAAPSLGILPPGPLPPSRTMSRQSSFSESPNLDSHDAKHRSSIRKLEKGRKQEHEKALEELEMLRRDQADAKTKQSALISRNKILERDTKDLKSKIGTLLQKASRDDQLIKTLQDELKKLKERHSKKDDKLYDNLRNICSEQESQISEHERTIERLQREVSQISLRSVSSAQPNSSPSQSSPPLSLPSSGPGHDVAVMGLDSTIRSLKVENDKLRELRSVLEGRINTVEGKAAELANELRRERRRNAADTKRPPPSEPLAGEIDKLRVKLELAKDEIEALKVTNQLSLQNKEKDIAAFTEIIDQTRDTFKRDLERMQQLLRSKSSG